MSHVPEIGAGAAYRHGWQQLWRHFWFLLGITLLLCIVGSVPGSMRDSAVLAVAYQVFVIGPITYGGYFVFLRAARDQPLVFTDLFEGFRDYWNVVLASLVVGLIIGIGFIFLIVPGIIFACKLVFTPYLVVDRKMRAFDAINESWRLTEGHAWTVFLMLLLAIPVAMAGVIALGVGVIVSVMWIALAFAAFYIAVCGLEREEPAERLSMPG